MLLWAGNVFEKPALMGEYRNKDKTWESQRRMKYSGGKNRNEVWRAAIDKVRNGNVGLKCTE